MICRDAAGLISRSFDTNLTPLERVSVTVHMLCCSPCRRFRSQLRVMQQAYDVAQATPLPTVTLSAEARQRITANLQAEQSTPPPPLNE